MLRAAQARRGLTLVELIIGIAIMSVLLAAGAPGFSHWMRSARTRDAAEAIQDGLNLARAEAVRRNTAVSFVLGDGASWTVGCVDPVADLDDDGVADCPAAIQGRPAGGGSAGAAVATAEVAAATGAAVTSPVFTSTLGFNGVGRVTPGRLPAGSLAIFNITNPGGGDCAPAGPMRCLRVTVEQVGQIRMCDPAVANGDPKGCLT